MRPQPFRPARLVGALVLVGLAALPAPAAAQPTCPLARGSWYVGYGPEGCLLGGVRFTGFSFFGDYALEEVLVFPFADDGVFGFLLSRASEAPVSVNADGAPPDVFTERRARMGMVATPENLRSASLQLSGVGTGPVAATGSWRATASTTLVVGDRAAQQFQDAIGGEPTVTFRCAIEGVPVPDCPGPTPFGLPYTGGPLRIEMAALVTNFRMGTGTASASIRTVGLQFTDVVLAPVQVVPEPGTLALSAAGLALLGAVARRRRTG